MCWRCIRKRFKFNNNRVITNEVWNIGLPPLRDRSRVVPRSDSACVFTERLFAQCKCRLYEIASSHWRVCEPSLVGWRTSDQDGWGLRSNLICRGIFEDFHAGNKGNLYSKIATPRRSVINADDSRRCCAWIRTLLYH